MMAKQARGWKLAAAVLAAGLTAAPAAAQSDAEVRLKKVEAEVRALQRKVFPGGDGKYFEPEITPASPASSQPVGVPSTTAVTDILARLDALEGQLRQLTSGSEESANAVRLLQDRVAKLEAATAAAAVVEPAPAASASGASTTGGAVRTPASLTTTTAATPRAAGPSAERLAAVSAVEKPSTGDAGADEYNYGFRLWDAKFYPEAVQQLTMYVEKHPNHAQISYGRNLLGRAYLDDGKPREAAPWFLRNYQSDKTGARAGDSLLYLAQSMIALKDEKRACIALAEFSETYPALATGRLKREFDASRREGKCN
jgi:TolA-binding protein